MADSPVDIQLFDRQIRLLGLETQKKIGTVRVGVAGSFNHAMCEALKNLVLLGVKKYTLFGFENAYESTLGHETIEGMKDINPSIEVSLYDDLKEAEDVVDTDYLLIFDGDMKRSTAIPTFIVSGQNTKASIWCCCKPQMPLLENQNIDAITAGLAGGILCEEIVHHLTSPEVYFAKAIFLDALDQTAVCKKVP